MQAGSWVEMGLWVIGSSIGKRTERCVFISETASWVFSIELGFGGKSRKQESVGSGFCNVLSFGLGEIESEISALGKRRKQLVRVGKGKLWVLVAWERKADISGGSGRRSCGRHTLLKLVFICSGFGEGDRIAKHVVGLSARSYERQGFLSQDRGLFAYTDGGELQLENGLRDVFD